MHNQDDKHQSFDEKDVSNADMPFEEPTWVKPVKVASAVMGMMIVAGLVLLVYGLSTGMGKLAEKNKEDRVFTFPAGQELVNSQGSADGTLVLEFKDNDGTSRILHIDPNNKRVINTITLKTGQDFGFAE